MFRILKNLFKREIRFVTADHTLTLTLLLAPIAYAFMYGSIYKNKVEEQVGLVIVDNDGSSLSRTYVAELNSHPMLKLEHVSNLDEAKEIVNYDEAAGYLHIEQGFEEKIKSLKQSNVSLAVNASRFLPASDITMAVTNVSMTVGGGVRKTYFNKQGMNDSEAMANTNPIQMENRPMFNENVGYGSFLLPGLLAVILQQTFLIGLSMSMSLERREKNFKELSDLSENNFSNMLVGKSLFYVLSYLIFTQFFVQIIFNVFNMPFKGSYFEVTLLMGLFLITLVPLGFLIGSFFKNTILLVQIMGFTSYPIFLITGYSMPLENLPEAVQFISNLLPTTPFLRAYTIMVQGGATLADQLPNIFHLAALGLFYTGLLNLRYRIIKRKLIKSEYL